MNKYKFINNLLETNKFSVSQKERFLKLVTKELTDSENQDTRVLEELKLIKSKIEATKEKQQVEVNNIDSRERNRRNIKVEYLDPKEISDFLIAYNQDELLKYTCHTMDDNTKIDVINKLCGTQKYDILKHQKKLNQAFQKLSQEHKINKKIYSLINCYINGGVTWSTDKIEVNWKSQNLIDWCSSNKNKVPHPGQNLVNMYKSRGFEFKSFISKLNGKKINSFSKLVIHFKNMFHIRADNSLRDLIEFRNKNKWINEIEFEIDSKDFWDNLELHTDVDKLLQAYDKLIELIVSSVEKYNLPKPEIKLSFKEVESEIRFSIHHKNSVFKKTSQNLIQRLGELHTGLINNQLNGLCDFYIRADFDHEQYGIINLWNDKPRKMSPSEKFIGVEHILAFKI